MTGHRHAALAVSVTCIGTFAALVFRAVGGPAPTATRALLVGLAIAVAAGILVGRISTWRVARRLREADRVRAAVSRGNALLSSSDVYLLLISLTLVVPYWVGLALHASTFSDLMAGHGLFEHWAASAVPSLAPLQCVLMVAFWSSASTRRPAETAQARVWVGFGISLLVGGVARGEQAVISWFVFALPLVVFAASWLGNYRRSTMQAEARVRRRPSRPENLKT